MIVIEPELKQVNWPTAYPVILLQLLQWCFLFLLCHMLSISMVIETWGEQLKSPSSYYLSFKDFKLVFC